MYIYIVYNATDTMCLVLVVVHVLLLLMFLVAMKFKLSCSIVIEAMSFFCIELMLCRSLMNEKI